MTNTPIVLSVENTLLAFTFGDMEVRTAIIDGQFWFCADDVCETLGIQDKTATLFTLEASEKRIAEFYANEYHKRLHMLMISEMGLFRLISSQDTETAKAFKEWIIHDVFPALNGLAKSDSNFTTYEPEDDENTMTLKEINIQAAKNWLELLERENNTLTDEARINIANEIFRLVTGHDMTSSI